jgi:3'-5' exoribonuclease
MPPLNVAQLAIGERVQHEFFVFDRAEKKTNGGDPFVILTLGNANGRIDTAPVWSNQLEWVAGAECGRIVQAIGNVSLYGRNGTARRQLQLTAPVRPLPAEQYKVDDFLPRIQGDPARLWSWIDDTIAKMESTRLRRVLDLFFRDDAFRLAFERTPGSTSGHHACIGGLLLHVFEVTNIARQTARTVKKANVDLVVAGALLHDIGKVEAYTVGPAGFTWTPCGLLLGHVVLGVMMLERRLAAIGEPVCTPGQLLDLQHMILAHHGKLEFGSPVEPMTVEAEIVHWADEASAKATDMMDALEDDEAFHSGGEMSDRKVWRVGRRVWRRPHDWE